MTMDEKKSRVEIISTTMVKPSSPTPNDKRKLKLSLFDILASPVYAPTIYFYNAPTDISSTTSSLKKSLSKTLELFYPFAGQFNDDFTSVECNDHGAYVLEAQISSRLSDFLQNPDSKTVTELLASSDPKTSSKATSDNIITLVQLTVFSCGGIAIGLEVSHKIADGFSVSRFAKSWAAISAGKGDVAPPVFPGSALLPPPVFPIKRIVQPARQARLRSRRFVFNVAKLADLKKSIQQNGSLDFCPSTLEAASSLLFRCVVAASGATALTQMVNLRERLTPLLPDNSIGNFVWPLIVFSGERKSPPKLYEIASIIRTGLSEFFSYCTDVDMFKGEALLSMVSRAAKKETELVMSGIGINMITFLSSFRPYEADFGWGEPEWVTSPLFLDKRFPMVHLKSGQEIEVWVTLEENVMDKFERNEELLAFTSFHVPDHHCRL